MEFLPGQHHKVFARIEKVKTFTMQKIQEHQDTLDPNSPRDYIDCFLMKLSQVCSHQRECTHSEGPWIQSFTQKDHFLNCFCFLYKINVYIPTDPLQTTL